MRRYVPYSWDGLQVSLMQLFAVYHYRLSVSIMRKKKIFTKNNSCFASEFIHAREIAGFPQQTAAKICGRSLKTITNWESGKEPCPSWALRLITLESRYMDALYGLQFDRAIKCAIPPHRTTMAANDRTYSTQMILRLVS